MFSKSFTGILILLFSLFSLGYAFHTTLRDLRNQGAPMAEERLGQDGKQQVYVLYLHGNAKCITCKEILERTTETLESAFALPMKKGVLAYREINMDLPENREYANTFEYFATSVVLALYEKGELKAWKNLDKVWDFANNPVAFVPYFTEELESMLEKGGLTP